ncbi:hypothetical protein FCJ61_04690 [Burkholderia metallica]|uniref:hypothetical protein n=1 Tax=Burkholderia metallica TaxID=488729 RepID=UPI00157AF587|nr:hypothetical protein [Burkholderia metallica]NTZ82333.1 hypothetical protein [Burkholderia metallica]
MHVEPAVCENENATDESPWRFLLRCRIVRGIKQNATACRGVRRYRFAPSSGAARSVVHVGGTPVEVVPGAPNLAVRILFAFHAVEHDVQDHGSMEASGCRLICCRTVLITISYTKFEFV